MSHRLFPACAPEKAPDSRGLFLALTPPQQTAAGMLPGSFDAPARPPYIIPISPR